MPTTSVDWFFVILDIFVLLHSFATHFFSPPPVLFPAWEVFRRHFWLQCLVSPGCEDTLSAVAVVLRWYPAFAYIAEFMLDCSNLDFAHNTLF
jgi:hypothetical protein